MSSGIPSSKNRVHLTHVNTAFNEEIQADIFMLYIPGVKYEGLNVVYMGTSYGERQIPKYPCVEEMKHLMETEL